MGWNTLNIENEHPILKGIFNGDHVYFVHSFQMVVKNQNNVSLYRLWNRHNSSCRKRKFIGLSVSPRKKCPDRLKNDRKLSVLEPVRKFYID